MDENKYICILDCETTFSNKVMSIGIVIANKDDFKIVDSYYYMISPEIFEPAYYSYALYVSNEKNTYLCSRDEAINHIINVLESNNIESIFAYNGHFDYTHIPELNAFTWFDIMKIAAYRQFNNKLPDYLEYCSTGRLKRGYDVQSILWYMTNDYSYTETHNAVLDAKDELRIMELLNLNCEHYKIAIIK